MRILVVDDEPDLCAVIKEGLRRVGFEVLCAGNGSEALDYLRRAEPVDILFSELALPDMSGSYPASEAMPLWRAGHHYVRRLATESRTVWGRSIYS
jgi:CheY-like chemotaxis protein